MAQAGPDALNLVGGHTCPDSAAADQDPALGFAGYDGLRHLPGKIRVVDGLFTVGANIDHTKVLPQRSLQDFLEAKPGMIRADHESLHGGDVLIIAVLLRASQQTGRQQGDKKTTRGGD
jgi:hypothetical protein